MVWYLPIVNTISIQYITEGRMFYIHGTQETKYRKISNIIRIKAQNLNDSHLVLKSSLPNSLKPGVKSRMKM